MNLEIETPEWCLPLLTPNRFKGGKGGRASGKSHFFAEMAIEESIMDADLQFVCIREVQKSMKFSIKKLLEDKIRSLGVSHMFEITLSEIRRISGEGIFIFQGMQDHTADSIKSLEGFNRCLVEEAQSLSKRSMELLLPTIRAPGSEIWFSWNPESEDDPVEELFQDHENQEGMECVHVNFTNNPFCPEEMKTEAKRHAKNNPDSYGHVWLGDFNKKSDSQIFNGKFSAQEFEPEQHWEPLHGLDWGFANDPTTAVRCYVNDRKLYIRHECGKVGLELDDTAKYITDNIPSAEKYVIRADCARPESISHVRRKLPKIEACKKWPGSVEDGVEHMRSYDEIIIHPECTATLKEFTKYSYKIHKQTGDILPDIVDDWNHYIDAIRYALGPLIKNTNTFFIG
jgi:phage terminase large subunit